MRILLVFCIVLFSNWHALGQDREKVNKLFSKAAAQAELLKEPEFCLALSKAYASNNLDSAFVWLEKSKRLGSDTNHCLQIQQFTQESELHSFRSEMVQSLQALNEALAIQNHCTKQEVKTYLLSRVGNLYVQVGDYPLAITYYEKAIQASSTESEQFRSYMLNNIGVALLEMNNPPFGRVDSIFLKLIDYYRNQETVELIELRRAYYNYANSLELQKQLDSAKTTQRLALRTARACEHKNGIIECLLGLSSIELAKVDKPNSQIASYLSEALALNAGSSLRLESQAYALLAEYHKRWSQVDLENKYLNLALKTHKEAYSEESLALQRRALFYMESRDLNERLVMAQSKLDLANKLNASQNKLIWVTGSGAIMILVVGGMAFYQLKMKRELERYNAALKLTEIESAAALKESQSRAEAQRMERNRIAQDLHDGLGNKITALKMNLQRDGYASDQLVLDAEEAYQNLRTIAHDLSELELEKNSLVEILEREVKRFQVAGMMLEFNYYGNPQTFDIKRSKALRYILQESLQNVRKHAEASLVNIQLIFQETGLNLTIEDNGKGFPEESKEGMGLLNMRNRAKSIDAEIDIDSSPGKGSTIFIHLNYD